MFHILKDYPVQVFNWHAWESLPALDEALCPHRQVPHGRP